MKSFNFANLLASHADGPTLRERAATLKASATKAMQRWPTSSNDASPPVISSLAPAVLPSGETVFVDVDEAVARALEPSKLSVANPSTLSSLIEAHRATRVGLDAAAKATDAVAMRHAGIVPSPEDMARLEQAWDAASDAEQAASDAIVRHRPSHATEAAILLRYLADEPSAIDPDEISAVLRNVAEVVSATGTAAPSSTMPPAPLATSAGLAEACDWAVKQVIWIDSACRSEAWDDERSEVEIAKHSAVWERAINEPVESFSDLAAKARLFGEDWERHNPDDGSRDGLDRMVASILQDVNALEAAPPSLLHDIIAGWAEWTKTRGGDESPTGLAAWERTAALRDDLISRAVALPATAENIPAKALALSWLEYVDLWFDNKPREAYCSDGKLALDIHAAVQAVA